MDYTDICGSPVLKGSFSPWYIKCVVSFPVPTMPSVGLCPLKYLQGLLLVGRLRRTPLRRQLLVLLVVVVVQRLQLRVSLEENPALKPPGQGLGDLVGRKLSDGHGEDVVEFF